MRKRKLVTWDDAIMQLCAQVAWDWIATVAIPSPAEYENLAQNLQRLRREIEEADGTLQFRSLFVIPKSFASPIDTAYVAVGGLSAGDWRYWQRRWKEIEGHAHSRLFPRWRARQSYGARPRRILEELLDGRRIGADVYFVLHLGAQKITRKRTLRTGEGGD